MTALTIEKLTKNCSGIKDIKSCHGSTKFSNFQLPRFVRHRKKGKDLNQVQRYWRTLACDTPSCDLISVFFSCNRVLTSDSVKSLIKLDHLIVYDICLTARLSALKILRPRLLKLTHVQSISTLRIFQRESYNALLNKTLSSVAVSMAGYPSKMSSFSIDSILALQETKCETAPDNDDRKNINALSIEELRDQDVSTSKCRDNRGSPSSSLTVGMEESSYEGKFSIPHFMCLSSLSPICKYIAS